MILILFANSPDLALLTLPLVIYHPVQLTIDGILAPLWRPWWESHASASPAMLVSKA
jgi:hypothetical protein